MGEKQGPNEITSLSDTELAKKIADLGVASNSDFRLLEDLLPLVIAAEKRGTITLVFSSEDIARRIKLFRQNK